MFNSELLEVAIGIIFVYLLVSILCTAAREGLETLMKTRAAYLEYGIRKLLDDTKARGLARAFFNHPMIFCLFEKGYRPGPEKKPGTFSRGRHLPSYIPARHFATALLDIAVRGPVLDERSSSSDSPMLSVQAIRANILNIESASVRRAILTAIDSANGDLEKARLNLQDWFDGSMDRVSGWYKRATQKILFIVSAVVVVGLNINTITIAEYLYRNDAARVALMARAEAAARDTTLKLNYGQALAALDSLQIPIGWGVGQRSTVPSRGPMVDVLVLVAGLLATTLAGVLGAPFWFDMLNKVSVIRSTVKPREKSPEEGSEDRQGRKGKERNNESKPDDGSGGGNTSGREGSAAGRSETPAAKESGPPKRSDATVTKAQPPAADADDDLEGCSLRGEATPDDQLPPAQGGVEE